MRIDDLPTPLWPTSAHVFPSTSARSSSIPSPALDRTGDHRHAERAIRIERGKLARALVVIQQIDLVHADRRLRAAALDGDQKAVDEPRPQRRRFHRDDVDDDVDVRGDEPLHDAD